MTNGPKIMTSKLGCARRQLQTAVRLYFNDADPISIHTLACASPLASFGFAAEFNSLGDYNIIFQRGR